MLAQQELATRFGENLARWRRRADLSQEDLAGMASVHRTEIGLLERGLRLPRIDTLVKLASSLEVEAAELLEGIDWVPAQPRRGSFVVAAQVKATKGKSQLAKRKKPVAQ